MREREGDESGRSWREKPSMRLQRPRNGECFCGVREKGQNHAHPGESRAACSPVPSPNSVALKYGSAAVGDQVIIFRETTALLCGDLILLLLIDYTVGYRV